MHNHKLLESTPGEQALEVQSCGHFSAVAGPSLLKVDVVEIATVAPCTNRFSVLCISYFPRTTHHHIEQREDAMSQ
jgi:hypothetical protein